KSPAGNGNGASSRPGPSGSSAGSSRPAGSAPASATRPSGTVGSSQPSGGAVTSQSQPTEADQVLADHLVAETAPEPGRSPAAQRGKRGADAAARPAGDAADGADGPVRAERAGAGGVQVTRAEPVLSAEADSGAAASPELADGEAANEEPGDFSWSSPTWDSS